MQSTSTGQIKLVSVFDKSLYPEIIEETFEDPLDTRTRTQVMRLLRQSLAVTGITDYFLHESHGGVALHLKSQKDKCDIGIAMQPYDIISQKLSLNEDGYEYRKVKNRKNRLESSLSRTGLRGKIHVEIDRKGKNLIIKADDKRSYFTFWRMMEEGTFTVPASKHHQPSP